MANYKNIKRLFKVVSKSLFRIDSSLSYDRTLEALIRLADLVHNTDTDESVWNIGESSGATLDDIIVGSYWFCADYHGGQASIEYRLLSVLGQVYSPGCASSPEPESAAQDVYEQLASEFED